MAGLIVAGNHLDRCEVTACKFARDHTCCFGYRHEGCIHFNPDLEHILAGQELLERRLLMLFFEEDLYYGIRLCLGSETIRLPQIDNLFEPTIPNEGLPLKKVYGFVFGGHEYTYQDNSRDHVSCPHCGCTNEHTRLGYYGSGEGQIACFECASCFEKFYFHSAERQTVMHGSNGAK